MTTSTLLNVLRFTLRSVLLNYMLILTPFIWKDTIYMLCRIFCQDKRLYFALVLSYFDHVLYDVYITWVIMYSMCTSLHLCRILPWGYGVSPRSQKQFYMEVRTSKPYKRSSFRLLVFTPEENSIWGLRLSKSYAGHHLRVIGFHPQSKFHMGSPII